MQKIYENTALELIRDLSKDLAENISVRESFTSINGLDKCVQEINFTDATKELYARYHNPNIRIPGDGAIQNTQYSWSQIKTDMQITKVGNYNFSIRDAIKMAGDLKASVKDQFYGMLLSTEGGKKVRTIFNPLHPIITTELMKENTSINTEEKKWSIALYTWNEGSTYKKKYPLSYSEKNFIPEIAAVIASANIPSNYTVENKNFNVDIVDDKFILKYEQTKRRRDNDEVIRENSEARDFLIPGQIINISGVAFPYYGVIYSRLGLAWNLCPMYAANINHPSGQATKNGMEGGSRICTHSGNSKTQMGVSSLNHTNTMSPLNSLLLTEGAMSYADQAVDASLEMFLGDEYKGREPKVEKALTFTEFKAENDGNGTKAQYIDYIKNRLAVTMAEEPDKVVDEHIAPEKSGPKYPYFSHDESYQIGDIVTDKHMEVGGETGWRIMVEGGLWDDYIEPTPTLEAVEEIQPWIIRRFYGRGSLVTRRGWIYIANNNVQLHTTEEPTLHAMFWTRIRPAETQIEGL